MARPGLTQHIKFKRLSRDLRSRIVARGVLELMWEPCYEAGNDYLGTPDDVELSVQWDGESGVLFAALLSSGFIEEIPEQQGRFRVHDLYDHAPNYVQKRMKREAERVARGKTISDLRRDAAYARHRHEDANDMQTADSCRRLDANGCKDDAKVCTPAPAPAPALKELGEESPTTPLVPASPEQKPSGRRKASKSEPETYPDEVLEASDFICRNWREIATKGGKEPNGEPLPGVGNKANLLDRLLDIHQQGIPMSTAKELFKMAVTEWRQGQTWINSPPVFFAKKPHQKGNGPCMHWKWFYRQWLTEQKQKAEAV
jgi:hypothetical protein